MRAAFWLGDQFPCLLAPVRKLSFIHFARWSVIPVEPGLGDRDLLLFESDFDGDWDEYIDNFARVLGSRIRDIWGSSYGFPGPIPTEGFRAYIRHNQLIPRVTYAAYPDASTTRVLQALELSDQFAVLRADAKAMGPAAFARRWREFLTEFQFEL